MLGYTNQFLTNHLADQWRFEPFWSGIFLVWESDCVTRVRCTRSAQEWHRYALDIQTDMESMRAQDAETDADEAARYWDGRNSEGVSDYVSKLTRGTQGAERATIRADYDGVRALLALWQARREQGHSSEPSIDAALLLFQAAVTARDGDGVLEYERLRELRAIRDLEQMRHEFDVRIQQRRRHLENSGFLPPREDPVVDARLAELEAAKTSEIDRARHAAAEEQRERSSKGGVVVAKHYAEAREKLIERFKSTFERYRSIAAAAVALAREHGFSERTAEQHLRVFVGEHPRFRPNRRGREPA